jgi:hypothetical protein
MGSFGNNENFLACLRTAYASTLPWREIALVVSQMNLQDGSLNRLRWGPYRPSDIFIHKPLTVSSLNRLWNPWATPVIELGTLKISILFTVLIKYLFSFSQAHSRRPRHLTSTPNLHIFQSLRHSLAQRGPSDSALGAMFDCMLQIRYDI